MSQKASFIFTFKSHDKAELIATAISPEVKHKIPKTIVTLTITKNILALNIESNDVTNLRAACNSYLRWINTAIKVNHLV